MAGKAWARHKLEPAGIPGPVATGAWVDEAACTPETGDLFTEQGGYADAVKICRTCPVQIACRTWAVQNHVDSGIYGGMGHEAREKWAGTRR